MNTDKIFNIKSQSDFDNYCIEVFKYQYVNNEIYQRFCNLLGVSKSRVKEIKEIPFLPIAFFKTEKILCKNENEEIIFTSSGTTGNLTSKHYVSNLKIYEKSFIQGFFHFYGNISNYCVLALLPAYLEREGSSLIYMTEKLIQQSAHPNSGFYLDNIDELVSTLKKLEQQEQPTLLIGVSFALLSLVEKYNLKLKHTVVMETGGMKGRRKELIRSELHKILNKGFNTKVIHSEYGMTELLSQAYSYGDGIFNTPPWMQIFIRNTEDATQLIGTQKTGGINIIDLANIHSCSFIATQDLGKKYEDNSFEVLGRFDHSDIRGCNLMVL